jgi:hypothetical protein
MYSTSRKVASSIPDKAIEFFFNLPNSFSCTTPLWSAQSSNINEYQESFWGKGRLTRKVDNLTGICEPIV